MKTYNDLYITTRNSLRAAGVEACQLEAKLIVSTAAEKTIDKMLRDLNLFSSDKVEKKTEELLKRRLDGEPVAYITGKWEFYGLPMIVTPDVLIPRMDTEVLVDAVKEILVGVKMDARILDLCCGSGCIACAIGHELPATKITGVDISAAALEVCRKNISINRMNSRISCIQADALSSPPMSLGNYDVIVSNPPYIASSEISTLDKSVKDYEPMWALDGGADGLKFYKAILKYWKSLIKPGGALVFEVGEGQAEQVSDLIMSAGFKSTYYKSDTLGIRRAVIGII